MRVQIGMLSGITDIHTLFGIFCLTATTMLFGWLMESMNGDRLTRYTATVAGHHGVRTDLHTCACALACSASACAFACKCTHSCADWSCMCVRLMVLSRMTIGELLCILHLDKRMLVCKDLRYVGVQDSDVRNGNAGYPDVGKAPIDWTPFIFGFIPHIAAWSIVACHFFRNVKEGDDTPGFVWAIIFILFILDGMFALVQFLQFKQVKLLRGFARAEFFYIILRCVALC